MQDERTDPSDEQLLRRFADSCDQSAFGKLFDRYHRLVLAACLRDVRDPQVAEDCTSAVFLLLAERAMRVDPARLASWLFTTARLTARNARRAEERRMKTQQAYAGALSASRPHDLDEHLNDAIARLRDRDREALLLRYMQGLSYAEIGLRLGLGETGARMRVSRGVELLKRNLGRAGCTLPPAGIERYLEGAGFDAGYAARSPLDPSPAVRHLAQMARFSAGSVTKTAVLAVGAVVVAGGFAARGALAHRSPNQASAVPLVALSTKSAQVPAEHGSESVDRSDPKAVIGAFAAAFYNADPKDAFKLIFKARPDVRITWTLAHSLGAEARTTSKVKNIQTKGDEAIATLLQTVKPLPGVEADSTPSHGPTEERVFMKRSHGQWFVSSKGNYNPGSSHDASVIGNAWSQTDVEVALVQNPALRAAMYNSDAMKEGDCRENMFTCAQALNRYAARHGGVYDLTEDNWRQAIQADLDRESEETGRDMRCRSGGTYSINLNVLGRNMSEFKQKDRTILVYEGRNGQLDFRHPGGASVGFVSGQGGSVLPNEVGQYTWTP